MKEWILQYAEQQSDEEKSESVKNSDEDKFDPVSLREALCGLSSLKRSRLILTGTIYSKALAADFNETWGPNRIQLSQR